MTQGSEKVLSFLKQNYGTEFTKAQIAEALGVSTPTVTGAVNSFVKKGLVDTRKETVEVEPATETRKAKIKEISYHMLNEDGLAYDPVAAEEARKELEAERRAARRKKNEDAE